MKYLHTMIRVSHVEETLRFFELLGLNELRRVDSEAGRFTLIFLAAPGDEDAQVELTHNWDEAGYTGGRKIVENDFYSTATRNPVKTAALAVGAGIAVAALVRRSGRAPVH